MSAVALRHVGVRYGSVPALRDLTLEVEPGELLVLVGPSGCGKTTALRAIAGLETVAEGAVEIGGRDVTRVASAERDVAMVFQSYALFPHLDVAGNLGFSLTVRRRPDAEIRARIGVVAEALGLSDLLARKPAQLSGGERQRVALGRAMVRRPSVFLMDEPLSNLDAQLRSATRAEIVRLQADLGTTTIYVTHDQVEALSMGRRVGILRDGVLQQIGTPDEVYQRPVNLFVGTFLGSPPMATFPARAGDGAVRWAGGTVRHAGATTGDVIAGIRPEHVHVEGSRWSAGASRWDTFAAVVEVVESQGDQNVLDLEVGGTRLRARTEPAFRPDRGSTVSCWLDPDHLHVFDATTGSALR